MLYSVRQCTKNPAKTKNVYTGISRIDITKIWHPVFLETLVTTGILLIINLFTANIVNVNDTKKIEIQFISVKKHVTKSGKNRRQN